MQELCSIEYMVPGPCSHPISNSKTPLCWVGNADACRGLCSVMSACVHATILSVLMWARVLRETRSPSFFSCADGVGLSRQTAKLTSGMGVDLLSELSHAMQVRGSMHRRGWLTRACLLRQRRCQRQLSISSWEDCAVQLPFCFVFSPYLVSSLSFCSFLAPFSSAFSSASAALKGGVRAGVFERVGPAALGDELPQAQRQDAAQRKDGRGPLPASNAGLPPSVSARMQTRKQQHQLRKRPFLSNSKQGGGSCVCPETQPIVVWSRGTPARVSTAGPLLACRGSDGDGDVTCLGSDGVLLSTAGRALTCVGSGVDGRSRRVRQ